MTEADKNKLKEVNLLFEAVPSERLREHVTFLLMQYIINTPPGLLIIKTPQIAEDMEFLLMFIDKAGKEMKERVE